MALSGRLRPLVRRRARGAGRGAVRGRRRRARGGLDALPELRAGAPARRDRLDVAAPLGVGHGANVETKLLLLEHAFERCGLQRVEFKTDARNERTRGALLALGAQFEGIFRKHMILPTGPARLGLVRDHRGRLAGGEERAAARIDAKLRRPEASRSLDVGGLRLKAAAKAADSCAVDAAQRDAILTRYREHARHFETVAAARRTPARTVISDRPAPAGARAVPFSARDRGSPTRLGRPREPRDRRPPLPLRGDGQEPRAPHPREASSKVKSPRRSRWLPAWAHQLTSLAISTACGQPPDRVIGNGAGEA